MVVVKLYAPQPRQKTRIIIQIYFSLPHDIYYLYPFLKNYMVLIIKKFIITHNYN